MAQRCDGETSNSVGDQLKPHCASEGGGGGMVGERNGWMMDISRWCKVAAMAVAAVYVRCCCVCVYWCGGRGTCCRGSTEMSPATPTTRPSEPRATAWSGRSCLGHLGSRAATGFGTKKQRPWGSRRGRTGRKCLRPRGRRPVALRSNQRGCKETNTQGQGRATPAPNG